MHRGGEVAWHRPTQGSACCVGGVLLLPRNLRATSMCVPVVGRHFVFPCFSCFPEKSRHTGWVADQLGVWFSQPQGRMSVALQATVLLLVCDHINLCVTVSSCTVALQLHVLLRAWWPDHACVYDGPTTTSELDHWLCVHRQQAVPHSCALSKLMGSRHLCCVHMLRRT